MPGKFRDLREYIAFLESRGDLRRVSTPVSAHLEITEIADRMVKSGGPALLFENVEGHDMPLLIGAFGAIPRVASALGVERLDELTERVRGLLGMVKEPHQGLFAKLKALGQLAHIASFQPKTVRSAPCQEVFIPGDEVDLSTLPVLTCWPGDAGPFITLPLVVSRDPLTGVRNIGIYRMQVYNRNTTGMHWQTHKIGAHHQRLAREGGMERMEVAVALGGDPATIWAGSAPLPPDLDEYLLAGFIREEGIELVKCKTVDLEVPAHAEIVLEGYVDPAESRPEGPFGDHTGYYSPAEDYPVFHVTAMTRRRDPIYPTTMVGRPPTEDFFFGKATERLFLPAIQMVLPEIVDINMPAEGIFHNLIIVSIRKSYRGQAQKVAHGMWGLGLLALAKTIVIVDANVNVQDLSEVAWRVTANLDPQQDIFFASGPVDDLDHASSTPRVGSKVGIDATAKGPLDGRERPWPDDIAMSDEIKALVDRKWSSYGI